MRRFWLSALTLVVGFLLGLTMCFVGPSIFRRLNPPDRAGTVEVMRVTSPDALFDGVLIRDEYGGATGGFLWFVFIVPKGKTVSTDYSEAVFYADHVTQASLVWNRPHLLEINYDKAEIERFQNIWASWNYRQPGQPEARNYFVEIRLMPFTPDYSLLTPAGDFRVDR